METEQQTCKQMEAFDSRRFILISLFDWQVNFKDCGGYMTVDKGRILRRFG